jgi:hypothetical protein
MLVREFARRVAEKLAAGGLGVQYVQGSQYSMLMPPHFETLAAT